MKKIIVGITAMIITIGAYAQSEPKHPNTSDTLQHQASSNMHPDGYRKQRRKKIKISFYFNQWSTANM